VKNELKGVDIIYSTVCTFAAKLVDGRGVTSGDPDYGYSISVQSELNEVNTRTMGML
jgi:hypothetical protein